MRYKKSQMEIMGLAVVVVLIVLGLLFAVKFILFKPEESVRKDYTNTQLSANILNTILNTNTPCNGISIEDLLKDASKSSPNIICSAMSSEVYLENEINKLLVNTLTMGLNKEYYFRASVPGKVVVQLGQEFSNKERDRKTQFLPTDAGIMEIIIDIYS